MSLKKKILYFLAIILLAIVFCCLLMILITYRPFIAERMGMEISYDNGKALIDIKSFDIYFENNHKCKIDSDVLNHLAGGVWSGNLVCENSSDPIQINITDNIQESMDNMQKIENKDRIFRGILKAGDNSEFFYLKVLNKEKNKALIMRGNSYNKDVWENILRSIEEY